MKACLVAVVLAAVGVGCGSEPVADEIIPVEQVPANVLDVAKKEMPGLKVDTAYRMKVDGQEAYEVRFKDRRGKIREVEVSTTGEVLAIE
jgi:hypothetical protein